MSEYRDYHIPTRDIGIQIRDYTHPAEPVVFLHFSGANLMMWLRLVPVFREHYHLIQVTRMTGPAKLVH